MGKSIRHIARKASYKLLDNGQMVKCGLSTRMRRTIEGNTADDRYHRAAYESSQRNTCAMLAETYRASQNGASGVDADLANNDLLKKRVSRQDNLRFNPQLAKQNKQYGLSRRNQMAVHLSRIAHFCNGVTEWGAAPTGMLLKSSRIAVTPDHDDRSVKGQVRIMVALGFIAAAVSAFSVGALGKTLGKTVSNVPKALFEDAKNVVSSYSAVAALSAICSLMFSGASALCVSREKLSPVLMGVLRDNQNKHINRLYILLVNSKDTPDAIKLIGKALESKVGKNYRDADQPVLLNRLLADIDSSKGCERAAKESMKNTLGAYQVEKDIAGLQTGNLLDPKADAAELLRRENHVVALTNLIEHNRIHADESLKYKDLRHHVEGIVKKSREGVLKGSASLLNVLGFAGASARAAHMATPEYLDARSKMKKTPGQNHKMKFSTDYMLDNQHQYGPVTRGLLKVSEVIRTYNHGVLLSLNYQLTRPIAWLSGRVMENLLQQPNSRTVSFSIGRAIASSVWAVVDAVFILSPAALREIGFQGNAADKGASLPWKVSLGNGLKLPIAATSTGAQMLLTSAVSFVFLLAASAAARIEGWKGGIAHPLVPADSKRQPLDLGVLSRAS